MDYQLKTPSHEMAAWLELQVSYKGDDCLIWPYPRRAKGTTKGRGSMSFHGEQMDPSRAMCILVRGEPVGDRTDAAHTCGNGDKGCVNPNHMRWATRRENMADKRLHGTQETKLKAEDVLFIRNSTMPPHDLARQYGVTYQSIRNIQLRRTWTWLDGPEKRSA